MGRHKRSGGFATGTDVVHGFLLQTDGSFITIDVPGATSTDAGGINNAGSIVGTFGGGHGYVRSTNGSFATIDVPGAGGPSGGTSAYGINDAGQIVGTFVTVTSTTRGSMAFLYSNGRFITIDVPGASSTDALGINNAGLIVGSFIDATTFAQRGFLATPVFAGAPGKANCYGQSVSALAQQYGGLNNAAATLGYASVSALQNAIMAFCD